MTQPVGHGYPDFGRFVAQADKLLLDTGTVASNVVVTYNLGFVGDVDALGYFIRATTQGQSFEFAFYEDAAGVNKFTGHTIAVVAPLTSDRFIPVLGPFCRLIVTPAAAGGSHAAKVWTGPRGGIASDTLSGTNILITATAVNVAAAGNSTQDAVRVWPGEAHWTVSSLAATWRAELRMLLASGAFTVVDSMQGTAAGTQHHRVFLPNRAARVFYTNTSAAAANFDTYLVGQTFEIGA